MVLRPRSTARSPTRSADGVTFAVAAGNESQNACNVSPARAGDRDHGRGDDQHRRTRLVLQLRLVPGHLRAGLGHHVDVALNGGTNTISGTSMASPHVAGAAALTLRPTRPTRRAGRGTRSSKRHTGVVTQPGLGLAEPAAVHRRGGRREPGPRSGPTRTRCAPRCAPRAASPASGRSATGRSLTAGAGATQGLPDRPAGTDFDLYLERCYGRSVGSRSRAGTARPRPRSSATAARRARTAGASGRCRRNRRLRAPVHQALTPRGSAPDRAVTPVRSAAVRHERVNHKELERRGRALHGTLGG